MTPLLDVVVVVGIGVLVAIGVMRALARITEDSTEIDL